MKATSITPPTAPRLRLRVTATAESVLRAGHPWLFAESIREQNRAGQSGELAVIYDRHDRFLAIGLYDPDSPLRVRVLHAGKPATLDPGWWQTRFRQATQRRAGLFDERTNAYRWINGESDGWPGLVLDRYDRTLVLKLYTAAWFPHLREIVGLIRAELSPDQLVLRLSRNITEQAEREFDRRDGELLTEDSFALAEGIGRSKVNQPAARDTSPVVFLETGLRFEANVVRGQKTGFFLDQRENRRRVETLAPGGDLLNAFSFTGGFSLYAARGGARSVTNLDLSAHALAGAQRNFALNAGDQKIHACRHETIQADAFDWLRTNRTRQFDLVVLDPPSLARREVERVGAIQAYGQLARQGIAALRPDGVLVAASCSAHVTAGEFFGAVREAAQESRRKFAELETTQQPADHPATFPEASYLKCIYLRFAG